MARLGHLCMVDSGKTRPCIRRGKGRGTNLPYILRDKCEESDAVVGYDAGREILRPEYGRVHQAVTHIDVPRRER